MKGKILIVGGGAMGTCIALHAARKSDPLGEPVILIEKDRLGAGSSGQSGAVIHQHYSDRVMAGMARDALKVYASFEATTGRSLGYRPTGALVIASPGDAARVEGLERDIAMQASIGIDVRRVEADEIRALVPGIEIPDGTIGAHEAAGGFLDSARAIGAFATLARDKGAVTRVGVKNPTVLVENGRAVGVSTSAGNFYAPQVVLATGAWTVDLLSKLDIELPLRVVATDQQFLGMPVHGEDDLEDDLATDQPDPLLVDTETRFFAADPLDRIPAAHPVLFDLDQDMYARCEPTLGRTRVGRMGFRGIEEVQLASARGTTDPAFKAWARKAISDRLPVYRDLEDLGSQVTLMTLTPDERPILGPVEELPGLYLATGFTGNDFHLAPSIGEGMAQMLLGQPVSAFDPDFFSLSRFEQASS